METRKGIYKVKNPEKYKGDVDNVIYRSGWELSVCKYLDNHRDVLEWSAEEVVIPYICNTDEKPHRYFMDFYVKYKNGHVTLIEVKPSKETRPPADTKGRPRKAVIAEGMTYVKNQSKWKAAEEYCKDRGWTFEIWTEHELREKGLLAKKLGKKPFKPLKKAKPFRKPRRK